MGKIKNIDDIKVQYLNKTFNWLTVIDVSRIDGKIHFICKCKCGNEYHCYYRAILTNNTKSCGCYNSSKEKGMALSQLYKDNPDKVKQRTEKYKQWCKDNPDKIEAQAEKYKQWCKDNPDKVQAKSKKISQYYKDNPDARKTLNNKISQHLQNNPEKLKARAEKYKIWCKTHQTEIANKAKQFSNWCKDNQDRVSEIGKKRSNFCKTQRVNADFSQLLPIVHPDDISKLLSGDIRTQDFINTKCPICNKYAAHRLHSMFNIETGVLKCVCLCRDCLEKRTSSQYEIEIAEYINTFYNEQPIKNSRSIIQPYELDLYYPEKKIAIEFNGDYWHSEQNGKNQYYHINKYKLCKEHNIVLVSVFECEWLNKKDAIKSYMHDLFNGIENELSFNNNKSLINNNYPPPNTNSSNINNNIVIHYYPYRDTKVYTCGYTVLDSDTELSTSDLQETDDL